MDKKKVTEHYDAQMREASLKMYVDPNQWPCWPRLPVKHSTKKDATGFPLLGFVMHPRERDPHPRTVVIYRGNVIMRYTQVEFEALPTETFPTFEALLDAGWRVD